MPGYVALREDFTSAGVDTVACLCPNDVFVVDAWGKAQGATSIKMLADGNGLFAEALDLSLDLTKQGLGAKRVQRFALIAKDGIIVHIGVGDLDVSGAKAILAVLKKE